MLLVSSIFLVVGVVTSLPDRSFMELLITRSANQTAIIAPTFSVDEYTDMCQHIAGMSSRSLQGVTKAKDVDGTAQHMIVYIYAGTRIPVARITQWRRSHAFDCTRRRSVQPSTVNSSASIILVPACVNVLDRGGTFSQAADALFYIQHAASRERKAPSTI